MEPDSPAEQRLALIRLTGMAVGALATLWPSLRESEWAEGIEEVCGTYGLAAGAMAGDWFELLRDRALAKKRAAASPPTRPGARPAASLIRSQAQIEIARLPTAGLYRSIAESIQVNPETALVKAQAETQKVVANVHRDTITDLSSRDPSATGWRRVGTGEGCDFCKMLIGRGAVYKDATARFASHGKCKCVAAPAFDPGRTMPALPYTRSTRRMSDEQRARANARAREWIARNKESTT